MGTKGEFLMKLTSNRTVSTEKNRVSKNFTTYPNPVRYKLCVKPNNTNLQHVAIIMAQLLVRIINYLYLNICNFSKSLIVMCLYSNKCNVSKLNPI